MTTGKKIADDLLATGFDVRDGRDLVLFDFVLSAESYEKEVAGRIDAVLSAEWPEDREEIAFSVRIHESGDREILGFNGPLGGNLGWLVNEGAGQVKENSPGYYLVKATSDGQHSHCSIIAFETEDQRAERLAKEEP